MANKTIATNQNVLDFLKTADPKKFDDSLELIAIMEKLSGEKATMWGPSIIGFGTYHYKYESGHEGEMCRIGFSPRKASFSLYVLSCEDENEMALVHQLGKIKTGKSCIYFKKLADIDIGILEKLIKLSLKQTAEKWG